MRYAKREVMISRIQQALAVSANEGVINARERNEAEEWLDGVLEVGDNMKTALDDATKGTDSYLESEAWDEVMQ